MASEFVWFDLITPDRGAALAFYGGLLGWSYDEKDAPQYTEIVASGPHRIGGVVPLSAEMAAHGARPGWLGYVGVADINASIAAIVEGGGKLHRAAAEIPDVGRFAVVADAQGAVFQLFEGQGALTPPAAPPMTPGHPAWSELHTTDGPAALDFYTSRFGWTLADTVDLGPAGLYRVFAVGGAQRGGVMTSGAPGVPFWLFYFAHADIDAAAAAIPAAGGTVHMGPHEVPGGGWVLAASDPQGAGFALIGPRPDHKE